MVSAFFSVEDCCHTEILTPLPLSASGWGPGQVRGMAVSGALARATEHAAVDIVQDGMCPVRWTLDMFRPARTQPAAIVTTIVRHGRRVGLVDAEFRQNDAAVARSRTLFAKPSGTPSGAVWTPQPTLELPPQHMRPLADDHRLYYSSESGWTVGPEAHQHGFSKQTWLFPIRIVDTESPTPFQMAASGADLASLVVNWGSEGLKFINADITLALARLPTAMELGVTPISRAEHDGISVGSAALFDREGVIGTATVVALANSAPSTIGSAAAIARANTVNAGDPRPADPPHGMVQDRRIPDDRARQTTRPNVDTSSS